MKGFSFFPLFTSDSMRGEGCQQEKTAYPKLLTDILERFTDNPLRGNKNYFTL